MTPVRKNRRSAAAPSTRPFASRRRARAPASAGARGRACRPTARSGREKRACARAGARRDGRLGGYRRTGVLPPEWEPARSCCDPERPSTLAYLTQRYRPRGAGGVCTGGVRVAGSYGASRACHARPGAPTIGAVEESCGEREGFERRRNGFGHPSFRHGLSNRWLVAKGSRAGTTDEIHSGPSIVGETDSYATCGYEKASGQDGNACHIKD